MAVIPAGTGALAGAQPHGAEEQLYVNRNIQGALAGADGRFEYRVPGDTFAHTNGAAVIRLQATLADGSPLPAWMTFDAGTGVFSGTPPSAAAVDIEVKLIARDDAGHEAAVFFRPATAPSNDAPSLASQSIAKLLPGGATAAGSESDLKLLAGAGAAGGEPADVSGTPIGFPVSRVPAAEVPFAMQNVSGNGDVHRLFVYQGISGERLEHDGAGVLRIPGDAFAHTDPVAVVVLEARLADGRPLPAWLKFDRALGTLTGEPPLGLNGEITIEVMARDIEEREARTTFKLSLEALRASAGGTAPVAQDTELGLAVDAEEANKARLEAALAAQAAQGARQAADARGGATKPGDGKPQPQGAAAFSEQLRGANTARDPLLDRIAKAGDAPPHVR